MAIGSLIGRRSQRILSLEHSLSKNGKPLVIVRFAVIGVGPLLGLPGVFSPLQRHFAINSVAEIETVRAVFRGRQHEPRRVKVSWVDINRSDDLQQGAIFRHLLLNFVGLQFNRWKCFRSNHVFEPDELPKQAFSHLHVVIGCLRKGPDFTLAGNGPETAGDQLACAAQQIAVATEKPANKCDR